MFTIPEMEHVRTTNTLDMLIVECLNPNREMMNRLCTKKKQSRRIGFHGYNHTGTESTKMMRALQKKLSMRALHKISQEIVDLKLALPSNHNQVDLPTD